MKTKVIKECLNIAKMNNTPNHPQWDCFHHFSFIIQRNKIVKWGMNRSGTASIRLGFEPSQKIHSEVDAYFKARTFIDDSIPFEVVNVRLTKTFIVKESCPCKCCWSFLKRLGCKRIYYSTNMGEFANIVFYS
jgi:deoxycytidylate deaminase